HTPALTPSGRGGTGEGPPARLRPGETLSYTFLWFGLDVLRGELQVADHPTAHEGRPHLALSATVRSLGVVHHLFSVEDTLSALVDAQTVLPARFEFSLRHRAHRTAEVITFDRARRLAHSTRRPAPLPVPEDARDLLSTYYVLRTVELAAGRTITAEFVAQGRLWPLTATVRRRGLLTIPRGTFPAWEVEVRTPWLQPYLHRETLWVWVSDDAARVPLMARVKFPLGWLTALLDDCRPAWPAPSDGA
ncbi:MAG: DUF3108 domain-containing protein, partial [Candidatus Omnitrophica bacterium]|nr:DUF3108 domain-containing protein [Candidatus Omnitrophota bacterium]